MASSLGGMESSLGDGDGGRGGGRGDGIFGIILSSESVTDGGNARPSVLHKFVRKGFRVYCFGFFLLRPSFVALPTNKVNI